MHEHTQSGVEDECGSNRRGNEIKKKNGLKIWVKKGAVVIDKQKNGWVKEGAVRIDPPPKKKKVG